MIAGFICEVIIFVRNHELANFKLRYASTNNNRIFYVAFMQFANLIIANTYYCQTIKSMIHKNRALQIKPAIRYVAMYLANVL